MSSSFESLKREARAVELQLDAKLEQYSRLPTSAHAPIDEEAGMDAGELNESERAREIELLLEKIISITDRMTAAVAEEPSRAGAALVQRYREVIHDAKTTFRRQQATYRQRREQSKLFRMMQGGRGDGAGGSQALDYITKERGSLAASHGAVDALLEQAAVTREALKRQRESLLGTAGRLGTMAMRLPLVKDLMTAITRRQSTNDKIISLVFAACVCFMIWWVALKPR